MKELVEVIAKSLVDNPDEVTVTETENEKAIVLELRVAQSDMGKVIGKPIQETWEEEVDKLGGLPENTSPDVSCYVPEHSDQIRVEFVIPCDKGNFKVFINYFPDGSLYNYVIWKNETK